MEFSLDPGQATYRIESYNQNDIKINGQLYTAPLVVLPEHLIVPWQIRSQIGSVENLDLHHFTEILSFNPQVILLGTGTLLQFPSQSLYACLSQQGAGLEVMTTAAACRTYAVLMAEGRRVAAALFS